MRVELKAFFLALTLAAVATAFHLKDRRKEGRKKEKKKDFHDALCNPKYFNGGPLNTFTEMFR